LLIDIIILGIPLGCLYSFIIFIVISGQANSFEDMTTVLANPQLTILISFVVLPIVWLYFALFESGTKQATPGKRVLSIKVTDLNGDRISFGRASARYFGCFLYNIPTWFAGWILPIESNAIFQTIWGLLGPFVYLVMLFTKKKQNLHDMISGTLVLEK